MADRLEGKTFDVGYGKRLTADELSQEVREVRDVLDVASRKRARLIYAEMNAAIEVALEIIMEHEDIKDPESVRHILSSYIGIRVKELCTREGHIDVL